MSWNGQSQNVTHGLSTLISLFPSCFHSLLCLSLLQSVSPSSCTLLLQLCFALLLYWFPSRSLLKIITFSFLFLIFLSLALSSDLFLSQNTEANYIKLLAAGHTNNLHWVLHKTLNTLLFETKCKKTDLAAGLLGRRGITFLGVGTVNQYFELCQHVKASYMCCLQPTDT